MDHRQLFHTSPMFETERDQNRNHIQSSIHPGSAGPADSGSLYLRMENMLPGGVHHSSNWNSATRSNNYVPSIINTDLSHHPVPIPGPSYHPFRHPPADRSFFPVAQNYADHPSSSRYSASSSNPYGHLIHGFEDGNTSSGYGRGPSKRKRTATSVIHERDSGYHSVGSLSDRSIPSLEKQNSGSEHWPWEVVSVTPSNRGSSLSIAGESSQRNVRSRSTQDMDVNQARAHVLSNPPYYSHSTSRFIDRPGMVEVANLSISANTREWNRIPVPSDDLGRTLSVPSASSHDVNHFRLGSSSTSGSLEIDSYHPNLIPSRNPVVPPQNVHFSGTQAARVGRSSYVQRAGHSRSTRTYHRSGHVPTSSERVLQSVPENYSSNYLRPSYMVGWRNSDRNGRLRIPYQRPSPFSGAADAHDRLGLMMVGHSTYYDSRTLLDQHRDMRLDVDNMSYEELLALGERIGDVSTGLSEDTMSKCLRERIHYPSSPTEEESNCVVCLEEYKNKDVVATLTNCGHDYHASCIRTWLSMKKVCPICKASVVADS